MDARAVLIGVNSLQKKFNAISTADLEPLVNKATLIVEAQAKKLAPVDDGGLRSSIHPKVTTEGSKVIGTVYTACEYAAFNEFGTGIKGSGTYPYKVDGVNLKYRKTPWAFPNPDYGAFGFFKNGRARRSRKFTYEDDDDPTVRIERAKKGQNVSDKFIWTKGQKAHPFMYPALHMNKDKIVKLLTTGYRKLLREAVQ